MPTEDHEIAFLSHDTPQVVCLHEILPRRPLQAPDKAKRPPEPPNMPTNCGSPVRLHWRLCTTREPALVRRSGDELCKLVADGLVRPLGPAARPQGGLPTR